MRLLLPLLLLATPALAATEDEWEAHREMVRETCLALLGDAPGAETEIEVDPFGSASFGVAILTQTFEAGTDRSVCIVDKQTGAAELAGPTPLPAE